jgi:hypothetical protein
MAEKGEADRQTDRVRKVRAISGERGQSVRTVPHALRHCRPETVAAVSVQ